MAPAAPALFFGALAAELLRSIADMMPSHPLSVRKLMRVASLAAIGIIAAGLGVSNLIAFDEQSRYFAAAELSFALVVFGALVHELRVGGWRSAGR